MSLRSRTLRTKMKTAGSSRFEHGEVRVAQDRVGFAPARRQSPWSRLRGLRSSASSRRCWLGTSASRLSGVVPLLYRHLGFALASLPPKERMSARPDEGTPRFKQLGKLEFEKTNCPVCGSQESGNHLNKKRAEHRDALSILQELLDPLCKPAHDCGFTQIALRHPKSFTKAVLKTSIITRFSRESDTCARRLVVESPASVR